VSPKNPVWEIARPDSGRRTNLREQIAEWIAAPEFRALARAFGATPPKTDAKSLLAWYDTFSAEHWDFRRGRERNQADEPTLNRSQLETTMTAAEATGMVDSQPPSRGEYDYCLILGGLIRACLTRPRFAAQLATQQVALRKIVALGGFRPLRGDELEFADRLQVQATNEFEAMDAGLRRAFGVLDEPSVESGDDSQGNWDWRVHAYLRPHCEVIAAPSSEPDARRANSSDTFAWWAAREGDVNGARILLVTNPIYVPYQGAAATQMLALRHGAQVETIGISAEAADLGVDTQSFQPFHYLQEIRSAVRGMHSLYLASFEL